MRILMVTDVYYPRINGVSSSIASFRGALSRQGIEVDLVAPRYRDEPAELGVTRVASRKLPGSQEDRWVHWRDMRQAAQAAAARCDVIHIQTPFLAHYAGVQAARRANLPVLATYHTWFEAYSPHYFPLLPAALMRWIARVFSRHQCNALDAVVVPSSAMLKRLRGYGIRTPVHVLPTGIATEAFGRGDGAAFRLRQQIAPHRPVALFVGRVAFEKNIEFLLQALEHALPSQPDLLLLIAGDGPAKAQLQAQATARGLGESVRFLGYLDHDTELPACYAAADVFVFASSTETQGLVLLEAMAAGLPVVALAAMGTVDILEPHRGSLTPPAQPKAFGHALADLLAAPQTLVRLAREARSYAREGTEEAAATAMAALYAKLIANHPQP